MEMQLYIRELWVTRQGQSFWIDSDNIFQDKMEVWRKDGLNEGKTKSINTWKDKKQLC